MIFFLKRGEDITYCACVVAFPLDDMATFQLLALSWTNSQTRGVKGVTITWEGHDVNDLASIL